MNELASPAAVQSSISIDSPESGIKRILDQMLSHSQSLGFEGLKRSEVKVLAEIAWRSLKDVYASRLDSEDPKHEFRKIFREDVDKAVDDVAFGYSEGIIVLTTDTEIVDFSQRPDYSKYDHVIVAFSGGKDSSASVLDLIADGCPIELIELWHHDVDGREGSNLMDWPITRDYCRAFADALGLPLYFSWLEGGIEREMLRNGTPKAPTHWENPDGTIGISGGKGANGTRLKFPQVCADLKKRWCSAYVKIDVMDTAIANQKRFDGKWILVVTGERAEESANRAKYEKFELHRKNGKKRTVHHWRPVHDWSEAQVWDIIERNNIAPHPAYYLGWGRLSCMTCIFGSKDQWASVKALDEDRFEKIARYEEAFKTTIKMDCSVRELAQKGVAYDGMSAGYITQAMSKTYHMRIHPLMWEMPKGAFGESCGPS